MTYKGHNFIKVIGDSHKPKRMWKVELLTLTEYNNLSKTEKTEYRLLRESDLNLIKLLGI